MVDNRPKGGHIQLGRRVDVFEKNRNRHGGVEVERESVLRCGPTRRMVQSSQPNECITKAYDEDAL